MSEEEDSYCRLCAEPTAKSQLIAPDEDVGINSQIATKMSWINVDVSSSNTLPNSICFSCFDLLERTWAFLKNVRTAQTKLNEIFLKNVEPEFSSTNVKTNSDNAGKPVDKDWEEFEHVKQDVKPDILTSDLQIVDYVYPNSLIDLGIVKTELPSSDDDYRPNADVNSSDSDVPLFQTTKNKKIRKKKKLKANSDNSDNKSEYTWLDYMCRCDICDAQCMNVMSLRLHSLQQHGRCCIFKCSDCGKTTSSHKSFINHARNHQKLLQLCCEYCNKCFKNVSYLKTHHRQTHRQIHKLTCLSCGTTFETMEQLQDHIILYTKKNQKRSYSKKKTENEDLKCDLCSKEFKSRSNLQQHKILHSERTRDYSCHICGKMFFTKGSLGCHLTTHGEAKPFKCEYCSMSFRAKGNLNSHISLHSGAKPFVCEQCGKSFRIKRHLKSHSIMHTDLKPYTCNYCNKTFRFKTRLNLHLRQHTGAKPYKCVYCERPFTNGSNYKKHMKRRHNIDTSTRSKYSNTVKEMSQESDIEGMQDGKESNLM